MVEVPSNMDFKTIIDNQGDNRLKDVIKAYAKEAKEIKIATGYFFLSGFNLIKEDLNNLREPKEEDAPFKIIMGDETGPSTAKTIQKGYDLREDFSKQIKNDLKNINYNAGQKIYALVDLIQRGYIDFKIYTKKKFHAKGYLFLNDFSGKYPKGNIIIGSSNFTSSGGTENLELNFNDINGQGVPYFDEWFDDIWKYHTKDFSQDLLKLLKEDPAYKEYKQKFEAYQYLEPENFFKRFIVDNGKEYLLKDFETSFSDEVSVDFLNFQQLSFEHSLRKLFQLGGFIISNAVGLGKTYVATKVIWYFKVNGLLKNKKVLLCVPPRIKKDWEQALIKFQVRNYVHLLSMGELQKPVYDDLETNEANRFKLDNYKNRYVLICLDESHHYKSENSNRRYNLKGIIKENDYPFLLQLTATPINSSHKDLLSLLELFLSGKNISKLEKEGLKELFTDYKKLLKDKKEFEALDKEDLKLIKEVEKKFSMKLTWQNIFDIEEFRKDINRFVSEEKIKKFSQPQTKAEEYKYSKSHLNIFYKAVGLHEMEGLLPNLTYEYAKLWEDEYKEDKNLMRWYRWQLYKRLESSLYAFYDALKKMAIRLQFYYNHLNEEYLHKDVRISSYYKKYIDKERFYHMKRTFFSLDENKRAKVRKNLKHDLDLILKTIIFMINNIKNEQLNNKLLNFALENKYEELFGNVEFHTSDFPFTDDKKFARLRSLLKYNLEKSRKILVFTESKATADYLYYSLKNEKEYKKLSKKVALAHGDLEDKDIRETIDLFEKYNKVDIIVTTDILAEGVNLPSADTVINFDLPFSPTKLMQRAGRALRINNPKKIYIHNFKPDIDVENEIELYKRLDIRIGNILEIVGLDFLMWEFDNNEKFDLRNKELKDIVRDLQNYQKEMAQGNVSEREGLDEEIFDRADNALRKIIDIYNIKIEDLTYKPNKDYSKPYYSVVNTEIDDFMITFLSNKEELSHINTHLFDKIDLNNIKSELSELKSADLEYINKLKDRKYREMLQSQSIDVDVKGGSSYKNKCLKVINKILDDELNNEHKEIIEKLNLSIKRNELSRKRLKSLYEKLSKIDNSIFRDDALSREKSSLETYIGEGVNQKLNQEEELKVFSFLKGVHKNG